MAIKDYLSSLSNEQLMIIIEHLSDKIGKDSDGMILDDIRRFSKVDPEDAVYRVSARFRYMDDQIVMESNVFGEDPEKLYLHDRAVCTIAELIVDEFLDQAVLLDDLGMYDDLDILIQSVANGLRKSHSEQESIIVKLSGEAPIRLAEKMESCIGTDDRMSAFGKT